MSISMYLASVPPIIRTLTNLRAMLEKAAAYAEVKKLDPSVLVNARLYPDMFPLSRQIQITTDNAKGSVSRLAGVEPPKFEDNETTFADLITRIDRTLDLVKSFKPEQIDGSEDKTITLKIPNRTLTFQGMPYLLEFVLPTIYFHVSIAYAILRHNGLDLGKMDFIGK